MMKALTIIQPWASFIAAGIKRYETRSWATNYRGSIAIHAGANRQYYGAPDYQDILVAAGELPAWNEYILGCADTLTHEIPFGAVMATAELVGCWPMLQDSSFTRPLEVDCTRIVTVYPARRELLFGDWTSGRYAWELANVKLLAEPIPAKGKQGLWNWEGDIS